LLAARAVTERLETVSVTVPAAVAAREAQE
jgi:hypothetical protein